MLSRVFTLFSILGLYRQTIAAPGRVGCFYDLQLCEANELCFNDSLFGTCVSEFSDAINYNDLEPEALGEAAQVLQYLIETGYKWQDSYTQCVVGKFLQSAVTRQRYDPEVCEYLKALLDVIDQNRGRLDQVPPAAVASGDLTPAQIDSESSPVEVTGSEQPHGEFLSRADMSTDFDQQPSQLPIEPMSPVQPRNGQLQDPNIFSLRQYLQAYQQAMDQEAKQSPNSDLVIAQKKSDPALVVISNEATTTTTASSVVPSTTSVSTGTTVASIQDDPLLAQLNNTDTENAKMDLEGLRALVSLVNSYPAASADQINNGPDDMSPLFATAGVPQYFEDDQEMPPYSGPNFGPQPNWPMNPDQSGFPPTIVQDVYVPDFNAIPPPEILQDMFVRRARAQLASQPRISPADLLLAEQLFGPPDMGRQDMPMMDQRMMDPRMMDPRLEMAMQMDPMMVQQQDPRIMMDFGQMDQRFQQLDPRIFMDPTGSQFDPRMMPVDPRFMQMNQPQIDPRMLFESRFGMNPNLMSSPPFLMNGPSPKMDPFMGMPMKRGGDFLFQPPPPGYGGAIPPFIQGGPSLPFIDPRMQSPYASSPYGFFPQGVALPFTQPEWRPPMALPDGFVFAEQGFPVLEAPVNESADGNDQARTSALGENIEEQSANGASGPTSPNKKDQEYRSLLPSDESQDQVTEDVTVTVVKGNAEKPIPSDAFTGTIVSDADDDERDDDYVFLVTQPQLDLGQARYFLNWLAAVMSMPPQTFYDVNINDDLLTFRVNPAMGKLNATYVAQTLGGDDLRTGLRTTNNLEVIRTGVGRYALENAAAEEGPQLRFLQTAVVQSESAAAAEAEINKKYDVTDPTFAFIVTEPALSYGMARRVLDWLAMKLHVSLSTFTSLNVEDNQVLFRVTPRSNYPFQLTTNGNMINASGVVDKLQDAKIQAALKEEFDVVILRSGIGDRVQIVKADLRQRQTLLVALIAVACVAAVLVTLGIIYLIRRNVVMRKKLHGLGGDIESSKEYEELCRQRMACKNIEATIGAAPDYKAHDRTNHSSTSSWSEEPAPTNMDITTGHMVLSYMEDHLKHKERMSEEWASLCTYEADPSKTDAGAKLENLIKNRYPDVLPYDHTRVHLNPEANYTKSDYINANLITDADPKNAAYIATQGPLPDTVSDFWQMVWENNSTVMVMLTKLRENDQDLCHVYWPKEGSECYNIFEVHLVSEHIWCDDYLVRNFYLKNLQSHETRTVTQFHYLNWPNLGVPSSLKTFLEFRRKINKCYKGGSSPIVVHCSDGVDRTGAYCLIDLVLNRMAKGVKEIDIAATLEHLRDQRMDMVRTKDQFEFVLTAVAQEIQAILKSMPQK